MKNYFIKCMHGIGDNIYARPFVKMLVERGDQVTLDTPLPFLYSGLGVKFVKPSTPYRTQQKSLAREVVDYVEKYESAEVIDFAYKHADLRKHGIVTHMEVAFGFEPGSTLPEFDLPRLPLPGVDLPSSKPIAVIRPVTHRREWLCTSRSPRDNYVAWCSKILTDMGYYTISLADCDDVNEWMEGDVEATVKLNRGELSLPQALSLIQQADIVIGGSGFIIPAAVAAKTNLFVIFGGRGGYDNPHKLFDLRMDMSKIGWALPTNFCRCFGMQHDCDKEIKDLDSQFMRFMRDVQR